MSFLTLSNVSKRFTDFDAVKEFNLDVEKGEFVSFLGPSGCGKTTTLRMIAGFESPTSGTIRIAGEDITERAPSQRNVGMVFQSYALFPNMTVAQNIGFGLRIRKESEDALRERVDEMLSIIHLEQKGNSYPYQLSGGQQQRVALARALAIRPQVLLLDEPLSALDAKIRLSLRAEIRAIQRQLGITAIYVTHDQEEALSISDRIVVMSHGRIEQVGTPFQIYNFPETNFVAGFVGTLNTVEAEVLDSKNGLLRMDGVQFKTSQEEMKGRSAGDRIRMSIRPERFSFVTEQNRKDNVLDCIIENITFLGSVVRIQVKIAGVIFNMDTFNNPFLELPKIGDKHQVTCSQEAVMVYSGEASA
ncbi:MAG: Vitamin B12 import ATP-binding protein BtuD [Anaerolineales bacterium]|nr:Vitamin B12 import ATP-binding protein BtuD [Anaerolineales bacterium]